MRWLFLLIFCLFRLVFWATFLLNCRLRLFLLLRLLGRRLEVLLLR